MLSFSILNVSCSAFREEICVVLPALAITTIKKATIHLKKEERRSSSQGWRE